jgi:phosphoheptose isomerase
MTKAVIYKDSKSTLVFTEGNKIYFLTPTGSYVEARDLISGLTGNILKDKKQLIELLLSMDYKEASRHHMRIMNAKNRKGKLCEGEFNELQ